MLKVQFWYVEKHVSQRVSFVRLLVVIALIPTVLLPAYFASVAGENTSNNQSNTEKLGYTTQNSTVLRFTSVDVAKAGLTREYPHTYSEDNRDLAFQFAAGLAAGDVDDDGDVDLYVVGGNTIPNALYLNNGDGTFSDVAEDKGVGITHWGSGPAFGDIDSDGDLDLFVGAVENDPIYVFENRLGDSDSSFVDITEDSGISLHAKNTVSATMSDYDRDGWVDVFLTHWGEVRFELSDTETVWRNEGGGLFSNASNKSHISTSILDLSTDWSYTANLFDIDNDDDHDLLLASDFNTSQVLKNYDGKNFYRITDRQVIKDQAGMGAAVGDYDNDGDFDWFVTSIYDLPLGGNWIGNRLYENDGTGEFTDITLSAQVEAGNWAWGACTQDFDNDGYLDIFHVNGWFELPKYKNISSRFFLNLENSTFESVAAEVGIDDTEQGRALACFDADRDGDIDIIVVNVSERHIVYYRNDSEFLGNSLTIKLRGAGLNTYGIGAKVKVTTSSGSQIRQLGGSNNYASHDPLEVHFGLGSATAADVRVEWLDRALDVTELLAVEANQVLTIHQPGESGLRLSVRFGDGDGLYAAGEVVDITASEPAEGYHFSHWIVS
ncbi:MAG: CRTAC1 family protein, partial [Gammaproteobacteria bacterium]|nr:CRTAC1 family protein [Gammaproteobacteria bacterium]